jgi:tRNA(Ile)-lysidine synthase
MLIARVRRTLIERSLISAGERVLCACSGGPDSAALLCVLARLAPELGFELVAASVDHGLRPQAHDDVEIAQRQAAALSVPFHALRVTVPAEASLQASARRVRYAALRELANALGAARIALGHTQDDQAETVLSRLLRGAGVPGLGAIDPARSDGIVRPLIDCARSDVHAFVRRYVPEIATDSSNLDQRFERVRIRTHVLPTLLAEDTALVRHLAELADDARGYARVVDTLAEQLLESAQLDAETLSISALVAQVSVLRRAAMRLWLSRSLGLVLGRAELMQLEATVCAARGEVWVSAGHCVRAEAAGRLCLRARGKPAEGQ